MTLDAAFSLRPRRRNSLETGEAPERTPPVDAARRGRATPGHARSGRPATTVTRTRTATTATGGADGRAERPAPAPAPPDPGEPAPRGGRGLTSSSARRTDRSSRSVGGRRTRAVAPFR